jgi:hypothetical protein
MLPQATTNKYGDILREFYAGLQNNSLSEARLAEIQRIFNELHDRETIYKSWIGPNKQAKLDNPTIGSPVWTKSPLGTYSFQRQADLSVADNTKTFITFDTFYQHGNNFTADPADLSKIIVNSPGLTFQISGVVNWDNNATGYRYVALEGFKQDGTSLGFVGLHLFAGTATEDNSFPVSFVADLAQLADMKYFKIFVRQTSGVPLTCFYILLSAFLT